MVECHGGEPGRMIIPIFFDIDPKDVRYQSGPFKAAFEKHQMESTDGLSVVEGWKHALRYVGGISGYHLKSYKGNQRDLVVSVTAEIQKVLATKSLLRSRDRDVGSALSPSNVGGVAAWSVALLLPSRGGPDGQHYRAS
ncbi:hypothetical protein EJ110_NYTH06678 [Nymphaea thermarum]|nr:hypothetical protein EJ110_NYTH06678 [Nymphaea thermarum]